MPLVISSVQPPDPEPPPPAPPPPGIDRRDDATRITWTSSRGVSTRLSGWGEGYVLLAGVRGLDLPEYQIYRRASGALDGDVVTGVRAEAREIFLPIRVFGADRQEARGRRRDLARDLDPHPGNLGGAGVLEVREFDGSRRTIGAHYSDGMEGSEGRTEAGLCWANYGLTFLAADPWWVRPERTLTWRTQETEQSFLPVLPLEVVSGAVIGQDMEIHISGSARSWPVWRLHGPLAAGTVLRSQTMGSELTLDLALTGEDEVVIDTRPRRKSVILNGDTNAYGDLEFGSSLWPLAPGANTIDVVATGMGPSTSVDLSYQPHDLTA